MQEKSTYRPVSVSVIAWILIVSGAFTLLTPLYVLAYPQMMDVWTLMGVSRGWAVASSLVSAGVYVASGVALLQGRRWGRTLFLVYLPVVTVASMFAYGAFLGPMLIGVIPYYVAFAFFLTRPLANAYFAGTLHEAPAYVQARASYRRRQQSRSDLMRVFGVICAVVGGFFLGTLLMTLSFLPLVRESGASVVLLIFFGVPALLFLLAGVLLWGRRRWMAVLGWVFAVTGGFAALYSVMIWQMSKTDYWQALTADLEGFPELNTLVIGLVGLMTGLIGAVLLALQWEQDRQAAGPPVRGQNG